MKIAAVTFAVLGGLAAIALGLMWYVSPSDRRHFMEAVAMAKVVGSTVNLWNLHEALVASETAGQVYCAYALIAGGVLAAAAGSFLVMTDKGKIAAGLFLVVAVVPTVLYHESLIATLPLVIAAGLAFLAKRKTRPCSLPEVDETRLGRCRRGSSFALGKRRFEPLRFRNDCGPIVPRRLPKNKGVPEVPGTPCVLVELNGIEPSASRVRF